MEKGFTQKVLDDIGYVRYIDHYGSDLRIVESARISYNSPSKGDEKDKKLLKYLYKNAHTSPFEQCAITYNIKLPLFIQAQMVRHRTQKLNQISARYTEMSCEFYVPDSWRTQSTDNKQCSVNSDTLDHAGITKAVYDICDASYAVYKQLLDQGVAREMARIVLPQNLYTEIYTTWDLNNLLKFFKLRIHSHAQHEIVQYAQAMYDIFKEKFPWCAEAYEQQ